ncbi:hypothetical protein TW78_04360 [Vibrio coralliilyticus]|uniref:Uncharacterized protein n=1 Tax=Vibrio coralliilyticus TaxID=190893 RepID=A0A837GAI8_9VIBR|nr:hypothetical protein [Vibrio coralliilyticus]KJY76668.1 hypothetical protein TW78_04360 [Vibrio coralliilyticus]QOU32941.1 hypothetical protein TW71_019125 [Vibrio coralliilyticus]
MKNLAILLATLLLATPSLAADDEVHWTATVSMVTAKENESAWVGLKNLESPNPSSATWTCSNNIVWLSSKDKPSPKAMLSTALTLYSTQKSVRIGVTGSGQNCEARYISARD